MHNLSSVFARVKQALWLMLLSRKLEVQRGRMVHVFGFDGDGDWVAHSMDGHRALRSA